MFDLTRKELSIFKRLSSPAKIQNFLDKLPINFERNGETLYSPRMVLKHKKAHCTEGAFFAAAALRMHGHSPLVIDLKTTHDDQDHAVAVFKFNTTQATGPWGAISKTNHPVLRYRDPIYKTIRELVMSYFHEYYMDDGTKTLRSYTNPIDLSRFDSKGWMTDEKNLWYIDRYMNKVIHFAILSKGMKLRLADDIELTATDFTEWDKKEKKNRWPRKAARYTRKLT